MGRLSEDQHPISGSNTHSTWDGIYKESEKKCDPHGFVILSHIKCSKTSNQFTHPGKLMEESTQQKNSTDSSPITKNNQDIPTSGIIKESPSIANIGASLARLTWWLSLKETSPNAHFGPFRSIHRTDHLKSLIVCWSSSHVQQRPEHPNGPKIARKISNQSDFLTSSPSSGATLDLIGEIHKCHSLAACEGISASAEVAARVIGVSRIDLDLGPDLSRGWLGRFVAWGWEACFFVEMEGLQKKKDKVLSLIQEIDLNKLSCMKLLCLPTWASVFERMESGERGQGELYHGPNYPGAGHRGNFHQVTMLSESTDPMCFWYVFDMFCRSTYPSWWIESPCLLVIYILCFATWIPVGVTLILAGLIPPFTG